VRNIWSRTLHEKYMKGKPLEVWIHEHSRSVGNPSVIWKGFMELLPSLTPDLVWKIGSGSFVHLGTNNFVGADESHILSRNLINALQNKGYSTLDHVWHYQVQGPCWLSARYLRLEEPLAREWNGYTLALSRLGICLIDQRDALF